MPRGQPDFGVYAVKETVGSLADMAELAVRLGSVVSFDRRGDVVFIEDFESDILRWEEKGSGTDHAAEVSAAAARNGAFSCKLTTGKTADFEAAIDKRLPPLVKSKVGMEVHWTRPWVNWTSIYFRLVVTHIAKSWDARIRFVDATTTLQYWDGSDYQDIASGVGGRASTYLFLPIKFVIDLNNDVYYRLLFGTVEYDLTSYALPAAAGSALEDTLVRVLSVGTLNNNVVNYIDDVIVTQNEP